MYSVDEALEHILAEFSALPAERIAFDQAAGRTLAQDVIATDDLPPFANSGMDGYAVRAADVAHASPQTPVVLPVVIDIPAGRYVDTQLQPGQAARILTGAPLPPGADLVVPVEDTDTPPPKPGSDVRIDLTVPYQVTIYKGGTAGDYIRPAGEDVGAGQVVLRAGRVLRPSDLGVLAALGVTQVQVIQRPRVAILSTGDELLDVDQPLRPGKIRDSNSYAIAALVERMGGIALRLGVARDRIEEVLALFNRAVEIGANMLISTAGVSVGTYDVVKAAVEMNGSLGFWKVNLRPGKPLAFGRVSGIPFIGLPGNPVSALVTFDVFVRPAILKMSGRPPYTALAQAEVGERMASDGRRTYARVRLERRDDRLIAYSTGNQGSNILTSLVSADGLLIIPEGMTEVPAGTRLPVRILADDL